MNDNGYATSKDAERAFYDAFERASLDAMMTVWAEEDTIICIHPMGPRLEGRHAIARSWRQIFSGDVRMRFEVSELVCTRNGDLAVHCVYENIRHGPQLEQRSLVMATNVYRSTEHGWRMILHHASPGAPPPAEDSPSALH